MIMLSLIFKMVYFIVMVFYMLMMALCNFKFFRLGTMFWLQAILDSTSHGVSVSRLLVATSLEVCEGIC
jgi:hypothetical protein